MTYVVPEELKAMLEQDAGKDHSDDGPVIASLSRILQRHEEIVLAREHGDERRLLRNAAARLRIARDTLRADPYFAGYNVDDDVAPRIGELVNHLRQVIDAQMPAPVVDALEHLRAQVESLCWPETADQILLHIIDPAAPGGERFIGPFRHGNQVQVWLAAGIEAGRSVVMATLEAPRPPQAPGGAAPAQAEDPGALDSVTGAP